MVSSYYAIYLRSRLKNKLLIPQKRRRITKAAGLMKEIKTLCALGDLGELDEKSSLNGRVSKFTREGSHKAHQGHQAHKKVLSYLHLSCDAPLS
jgi:hypothetical protein